MSRFSREWAPGGRRAGAAPGSAASLLQQHRTVASSRGSLRKDAADEGLDLFSRTRRSLPVVAATPSEEDSDGSPKLGSISTMPAKVPKSGMDDLLSAADMGKHDYDWLLTPPATPISSPLDAKQHQLSSVAQKTNSPARTVLATKASRTESNNQSTRPSRSSSLTRPSIASTYSGHISYNSNRTPSLNTSTASVTSHRPSTPTRRLTASSTTRQTTFPSSRPTSSRPSTPLRSRPTSITNKAPSSNGDRARPLYGTRPSTPTSCPQASASSNSSLSSVANRTSTRPSTPSRSSTPSRRLPSPSPTSVSSSRPSTPTRRTTTAPPTRSPSVGPFPTAHSRNSGSSSRPSSPSPRIRPSAQPNALPEFSHDVPPNLRTKLPERSVSTGRTRPGSALTVRANMNSEVPTSVSSFRRPSPIVTRGRISENSPKIQLHSNGHETAPEPQKSLVSNGIIKKPAKSAVTTESTGFGRTISKKSLDMALRHMDIRQGVGGKRGASLFPQSIRSGASKGLPARTSDPVVPLSRNGTDAEGSECGMPISDSPNGAVSENGDGITRPSPDSDRDFLMKRSTVPDVYESARYDAILLKEDSKNMNWLHSIEDKSDQSPVFDHRFEPLPEPFARP